MENINFLNLEYFFYLIYYAIVNFSLVGFFEIVKNFLEGIQMLAFILSGIFIAAIVYAIEKIKAIRAMESEQLNAKVVSVYDETVKGDPALSQRWSKIITLVDSVNQNDWMLAIIEADIVLGEILNNMGFQGDSIGEKLKRVEPSDFLTLQDAWEAHKVRNVIAHQGSSFTLNQREAKRVIGLYKNVFEEFYYL